MEKPENESEQNPVSCAHPTAFRDRPRLALTPSACGHLKPTAVKVLVKTGPSHFKNALRAASHRTGIFAILCSLCMPLKASL
jgi:hypothetical protein